MKTYPFILVLATTLSLWNCKQDQLDQVLPASNNPSAARLAAEAAPTRQWDIDLGGSGTEVLSTAIPWWNGSVLLGGTSDSPATGDKQYNPSYGGMDYWIANVGPDGTVQGKQSLGGSGNDILTTLVWGTDKGLLVAGFSDSPAATYKSQPSKGLVDYYVVKLSPGGMLKWNRTLGTSGNDILTTAVATADGGFLLGGNSASSAEGDKTQPSKGGQDFWIVKLDANGTKQWDKTIGTAGDDFLQSILVTADGGYLLAGSVSADGGDKTGPSRGGSTDGWIVKLDADGNKLWDKVYGGSGSDLLMRAITTHDGGFMLGFTSSSPAGGDKSQASVYDDYWVVKLNGAGNKQWDKTLSSLDRDALSSLMEQADGSFLVGGTSQTNEGYDKTEPSKGQSDFWIVKLDATGNKRWDKTIGGSLNEQSASLVPMTDGGFVAAGQSYSGISGDKTQSSRGGDDFWAIKLK